MAEGFHVPEGSIRVNARGQWLHGNEPIADKVANLFAKHVACQGEGGYVIAWQQQTQAVEVEDTAYFVRHLSLQHDGHRLIGVRLHLSDATTEALDPNSLMQSRDNVLYCRVRRGQFLVPCRFEVGQYYQLAEHVEQDGDAFVLPVGQERYAIGSYDARPQRIH